MLKTVDIEITQKPWRTTGTIDGGSTTQEVSQFTPNFAERFTSAITFIPWRRNSPVPIFSCPPIVPMIETFVRM